MSGWSFNLIKSHHHSEELHEPFGYSKNFASEIVESERKQGEMKNIIEKVHFSYIYIK